MKKGTKMNVFQLIGEVNGPKLSNTVNNNQNPHEWDRTRPKMVEKGKKSTVKWQLSKLCPKKTKNGQKIPNYAQKRPKTAKKCPKIWVGRLYNYM